MTQAVFSRGELPVVRITLETITVLIAHVAVLSHLVVLDVRPEPFVLLAVLGGLELGTAAGALLGFLAGGAGDVLASTPIGLWALICTMLAVVVGYVRDKAFSTVRSRLPVVLVVATTATALVVYCALAFVIAEQPLPPARHLLAVLVIASLWNVLLAMPLRSLVARAVVGRPAAS